MAMWFTAMLSPLEVRSTTARRAVERGPALPMFRCSACHQAFHERAASVNHARIEHNRDYSACRVVTLLCRTCGRELLTSDAWRRHRAEAHAGRARACERVWSAAASWPSTDDAPGSS
jgi:hypothetical protein